MQIIDLRVNHLKTPLGFQTDPVSFSWKVVEAGKAKEMRFARIRIFCGGREVFDSGEDPHADCLDYRVELRLNKRTRYEWSVEVYADNGERAEARSWFETGKLGEPWRADWIAPKKDTRVQPVMRKRFLAAAGRKARLYICGLGLYEAYLNGKKVGEEYLAPGYHSYDFHLQAQTYDVTAYLQNGENEVQIWLGDGWYKGRLGFDGGYTDLYGAYCCVIGELFEEQENGNEELLLKTDATWEYRQSPVVFSNIYDGEIYDARKEAPLSEEEGWEQAMVRAPEKCGPLCDRYSLPIVKKEKFSAVVLETPKQETVLDFGQNLTGWVEFDCELPEGMQLRLTASEIMQDACFYRENLRTAKAEFTYRSHGKRAHVRPHFTFYGFRYMKVEYLDVQGRLVTERKPSGRENFTAYHLRSDFDVIGAIRTGNEKVNKLFSNALWGQKDNFLDVPTDCPQRDERLGWTGDAQIFSETACFNMYMPAFYRKYLWDMRAEQGMLNGSVPNVVPRLKKGMAAEHGACPWADAGVIIPWNVYRHYGSKTLLKECYPGMKAWVDCEREREEALEGPHLIKDGFHFADWLALDNDQPGPFGATDPLYIASAYYYIGAKLVSESAKVLGYTGEAASYQGLAEEIREALQKEYFDENGLCVCRTQTGAAIAIMFGLNPKNARQAEGKALESYVKENQGHLNTGFVGTTMLCPALTKTGCHETAVGLLLDEKFPGWLYCVNLGATTIWERWNSVMQDGRLNPEGMNSLNHYSYGSIVAWMYGELCGIHPQEAGFRKAMIEPHPDPRLGFAEGIADTAAGRYVASWRYQEDGSVAYHVEVPFQAQAIFILYGKRHLLKTGSYDFYVKEKADSGRQA